MKNVISMIVATAGLAALASAQTSALSMQTSLDGISWTTGNRNVNPGTTVLVRAKMDWVRGAASADPVGFATLTFQPTISNWQAGSDTLNPFATQGNNTNGGAVADVAGTAGPFGRIIPFASTGPTSSDTYIGHNQTNGGTNYLRIARSTITNWVGDGPTTTSNAVNNFNGAGGLACVQKGSGLVTGTDPAFNAAIADVVLFKFSITVGSGTAARTLTIDAPLNGMSRNATTGAREAAWFTSSSDNFGGQKAAVAVSTSTLTIVPAPGALAMLGMGGAVALRRRRR